MKPAMGPARETNCEAAANLAALIVILATGVAVRAYYLSLPIKYDEAATFLEYARYPLSSGMSNYSTPNNHLLNTFLIHLSTRCFGNYHWALRLADFLFGNLVIPATYMLGRIFAKREAALVAAAFVAGWSKLVEYSVNARGYMLLVFLSIALVAIGFRVIRVDSKGTWAAFAAVAALGFYTVPTMLYVYAGVLLWVWAKSRWDRVALKRIVIVSFATFAPTALLYLPVLLNSGLLVVFSNRFVQPLSLHDFLRQVPMLPFALWNSWTDAVPGPVLIALLVGLAFAIFYDNDLFGLLISFLVAVAALLVIQRVIPPSRVFLFAAPIVALCASSGLLHLIGRWWGDLRFAIVRVAAVALAAWMALAVVRSESVIASEETGSFQDITEVMNFLNGVATPDDLVLMVLPVDQPFRYYLQLHKTDWEPVYLLPHVKDHDEEGPDERPSGKLFIVLRDHHGPIPSREQQPMTLDRISQFYRGRSEQNPVFRGPYSSVYTADGATVERGFCEVFCFRRTRIAR